MARASSLGLLADASWVGERWPCFQMVKDRGLIFGGRGKGYGIVFRGRFLGDPKYAGAQRDVLVGVDGEECWRVAGTRIRGLQFEVT